MRPDQLSSIHDRWAAFSRNVHAVESEYYTVGKKWHDIPPAFREMYLVYSRPLGASCDDALLVTKEGSGLGSIKVPRLLEALYKLHGSRSTAKDHMNQGDEEQAKVVLENGEKLYLSVKTHVTLIRGRVDEHCRFWNQVKPVLSVSSLERNTARTMKKLWAGLLPENVKAWEMGLTNRRDLYAELSEPNWVNDEFEPDTEVDDNDDDDDDDDDDDEEDDGNVNAGEDVE